jgi:hypothetical protein
MAVGEIGQLHFRGSPPLMSLMEEVSEPLLKRGSYQLDVGGNQAVLSVRPMVSPPQKYSLLRLRISKSTPPGTYLGGVALEDHEVPVVIDVEPREDLRFIPRSLSIAATPGRTVEAEVTIVNTGNVGLDLRNEYTFCVFDTSGIDQAFFAALTDQNMNGGQRLERFMEELSVSHGGLVRLRLKAGTMIPPGEAKKIQMALECPHRLRPGHTYSGVWSLWNFQYSIQLAVIETKKEETK